MKAWVFNEDQLVAATHRYRETLAGIGDRNAEWKIQAVVEFLTSPEGAKLRVAQREDTREPGPHR